MSRPVYYVTVFQRFNDRAKRWSAGIATATERPQRGEYADSAWTFEVECPTKGEAPAVVMEWLAKGQPAAMTVRRVGR